MGFTMNASVALLWALMLVAFGRSVLLLWADADYPLPNVLDRFAFLTGAKRLGEFCSVWKCVPAT
jgi:hypothetical protein